MARYKEAESMGSVVFGSTGKIILLASGMLGVILLLRCLTAILFHPLRNRAGPFWARLSSLPLVIQCRQARKTAWVLEQHATYGPVVRISPNQVSINSPEAINQIYGHKTGFLKGPFYDAFMQVQPVLFNTRDPAVHQRKRKYINPAFSARHLGDFEGHVSASITALVWKLREVALQNGTLDFCRWSNFLAFDVIGDFSFGAPFGFLSSGRDDLNLISTIDARGEVLNALGHLPSWIHPYMRYFRLDPFFYEGLRATSHFAFIGQRAYQKRKFESSDRQDLMSFLMKAKDPDTGSPLPENEIVAEAISFLVGGSDTTSSTMTNFMDYVSRDSSIQERLYEELKEAFPGPLEDHWVAEEKVARNLEYLNAVLKEVMRLRPTSSTGLERVVPEGGRTIAGVWVPGGALVSVPTAGITRNEEVYHDANTFNPDRWLEDDMSIMEYYVPFSTGPRACVGRNFAWMEMLKTLATIFRLFKFERTITRPSDVREGFFLKVSECDVKITFREKYRGPQLGVF